MQAVSDRLHVHQGKIMSNQTQASDKPYYAIRAIQVHLYDAKRSLTRAAMNIEDLPKEEAECFAKTVTAIKEIIGDLEISIEMLSKFPA